MSAPAGRLSFASYPALSDTPDTFAPVRELGLEANVAELDEYGYTVVGPEKVGAGPLIEEIRVRLTGLAAARFEIAPDEVGPGSAATHRSYFEHRMLAEGRCFERALMNPVSLALITHLLGESCVLSSMSAFMKGPSDKMLDLHTDNVGIPAPFPAYSQVANSTLLLSDYSADDGAITFVPRSHKLARHPLPSEVEAHHLAVPVEAATGSLVIFHGNTWHGSLPRRTPGYRFSLISYFVRMYLLRQEAPGYVTDEMRARNGPRFARLAGDDIPYPFGVSTRDKTYLANAAGKYQHT
ncbi:phytanoyl-CoA dioxygenase family protein [Acidiferrimicrobium sp. IK]|uniref:phytanoyl-CoA dioxygenase family protein n=1 Tax=Acidiferrimicrobium sp. IK TaxID=2871700 RepID=UPI0021CB74E0|nr:phytanoyl-CoA dioxygenase family protein [Acidiferrimicrobium sp. IK]MCU4183269.1 phytanoyl-CoA dioxygenase family protein [Acidiferrimicrobium sp. IK]